MKPNEPKSSAAAACPASARNTRERGGERARQEREGGRKNKMREIEWRVQKNRAKIHVGHSNSPASLFPLPPPPASSSSPYFFLFIKPLFVPFFKDKRNKRRKSPKVFSG